MANYDKDITGWITVGGRRIPLRKGQSKADAIKSNVKRGEGKTKVFYNYGKKGMGYKDYNSDAAAEDDIKKETKKRGVSVVTKEKNKAIGLKRKERYDAKTNTWKKDNVPKRLERKSVPDKHEAYNKKVIEKRAKDIEKHGSASISFEEYSGTSKEFIKAAEKAGYHARYDKDGDSVVVSKSEKNDTLKNARYKRRNGNKIYY